MGLEGFPQPFYFFVGLPCDKLAQDSYLLKINDAFPQLFIANTAVPPRVHHETISCWPKCMSCVTHGILGPGVKRPSQKPIISVRSGIPTYKTSFNGRR